MRGTSVRKLGIGVLGAWLVVSLGSIASGGNVNFSFTVDPSSGPPGTTVTITANDCGEEITGLRAAAGPSSHVPGTGLLLFSVPDWGVEFEDVEGGSNDEFGVGTATFVVPSVSTGTYVVDASCEDIRPCATAAVAPTGCSEAELRAAAFGDYAPGSFTVTAPSGTPADTANPVSGEANTVG
jgi:hypothetical protein